MNTTPDETTVARWLDDELQGAELAAFEASVRGDEGLIARREAVRAWRREIAAALPATEEPPYPEFFNSRIEWAIRQASPRASHGGSVGTWRRWLVPVSAAAGMALAFWLGTKTGGGPQPVAQAPRVAVPVALVTPVVPAVYTPERGVDAEWFSSEDAAATVIVLEGLDAIPDTLDFSETVQVPEDEGATARMANSNEGGALQ